MVALPVGGPTAPVSGPAPAVPLQSSAATAVTTVRHDLVTAEWVENQGQYFGHSM